MSSPKTVQVSASNCDAHEYKNDGSGGFYVDGVTLPLRSDPVPTGTDYIGAGVRFTGLSELVGKTIVSAILEVYVITVAHDDANMKIYYDDVDNSPVFADGTNEIMVTGRTRSSGYVSWVGDGMGSAWQAAPDLKTILQSAVDGGKLASGVWTLLFIPNTDIHKQLYLRSYDDTTAPPNTWGARLTVTYTDPATPDPFNAVYIWSVGYYILQTPSELTRFLSVLDAEAYDRVYLSIDSYMLAKMGTNPEWFSNFISQCLSHGADVFAMLPYASAGTSIPSATFAAYIAAIIAYNQANPTKSFAGIMYDCEPASGSSWSEHNTFIANLIAAIQADKLIEVSGDTIVDLGLILVADVDPRWGTSTCEANFLLLCAELAYFEAMLYADTYDEILAYGTDYNGGGQGVISLANDNSIPFSIVQETEEWGSVYGDKVYSWYAQGYDTYKSNLASLAAHYLGTYPSLYLGVATHDYSHAVSCWHAIHGVVWPKDVVPLVVYQGGETVTITVNLRTSDTGVFRPYGVKLELYDPDGVLVDTQTRIVVMTARDDELVSFSYELPLDAPAGNYSGKVSVWDLDLNNDSRYSMLYYADELTGNGWGMAEAVLNYDMDTLAALTTYMSPYGDRAASVAMRDPFLLLQSTGVIAAVFTVYVEGEEEEEEEATGTVLSAMRSRLRIALKDEFAITQIPLTIDDCDTHWSVPSTYAVITLDSSDKQQGTASMKAAVADGFTTGLVSYHDISSLNLTGYHFLKFWVKSSIDLAAGDLQILIDDTPACASALKTLDVPACMAGVWHEHQVLLGDTAGLQSIVSVGLSIAVDNGVCILRLDDIRAIQNAYKWTDGELDRHLARAVNDFSYGIPYEDTADIATTSGSRQLSIASLSDRIKVLAIEYPVDEYPPSYQRFSLWQNTVTLLDEDVPDGSDCRVYYGKLHTLSSEASTIPVHLEELVLQGAQGYALQAYAAYATDRVNADYRYAQERSSSDARYLLQDFRQQLRRLGRFGGVRKSQLYTPASFSSSQSTDWGP